MREREREITDELAFHRDLAAMQQLHEGSDDASARRAAALALGNQTSVREEIRELSALRFLDTVARDFRYTLHTLRASPVFTGVSLLTLALGIGATATIFSLLFSILFARLPVPQPDSLVQARITGSRQTIDQFRNADFQNLRNARIAGDLAAYTGVVASVRVAGAEDYLGVDAVSGSFFATLGLRPRLGRFLDSSDVASGATTVVISEGFWRRMLDADASAIGKSIGLGGVQFTIVGIAPADYHGVGFPSTFELAIPLSAVSLVAPNSAGETERLVWVIGRTQNGASLSGVASVLDARFRACCGGRPSAAGDGAHITLRAIPRRDSKQQGRCPS